MKYTDADLEEILNKLITSTRSPRGNFSAKASYPMLKKRLHTRTRRTLWIRSFAAVAAAALLCLSVWTAYLYTQPGSLQTVSTLAETQTFHLPDGSRITLNHYSSLTYPERFGNGNREVALTGEGYFEVSKDKKRPFIVEAGKIQVKVLGTQFNIDAYQNNPEIRTTLLTGSVAVSSQGNAAPIILKPNETAIYNKVDGKLTRSHSENAKDEICWRQGEFRFDHMPLKHIVRELSNSFGVSIQIADSALLNYRITARFRNGEDLNDILSVLQSAGYFRFTQQNKQIVITTKPNVK